uniref:uncharacterized protein LOC122580404 n=1 Tax=Erigeron canadensis TaxID=72917 RepID=UPI001CB98E19|nr:uncharacterized protein LOC122580404 [Erigeron canadensis]
MKLGIVEIFVLDREFDIQTRLNREILELSEDGDGYEDAIQFPDENVDVPTLGIQPLTGANYTAWKDQLDLTLGYLDLDYAIRNDEPAAIIANSTAEQKAAFEKWDKANRLSLMTVKNSIPLGLRGAIPESDKVKDYLKSVEDYFQGSSKAHASSLMLKMLTLKYDGSSGVREHIMKMSDMANKLKTLEMEVSDNFLVHFIMTSLPAQFDAFKINYNAQKDKLKMEEG